MKNVVVCAVRRLHITLRVNPRRSAIWSTVPVNNPQPDRIDCHRVARAEHDLAVAIFGHVNRDVRRSRSATVTNGAW